MKKREDIQGLRAIAIISVILYHIWPLNFPNGYLGVDIFFVISGYLIAKCLQNIGIKLNIKNILNITLDFYKKRIKRIVPIYLGVICATISISRTLMLESDFKQARYDMYWSISFITNIQSIFIEQEDYFNEVFSYRPFLHTWSLGVEIQFYLLSPILMLSINFIGNYKNNSNKHFKCFIFCSFLLIFSLIIQQLITQFFGSTISFGFIFCRFWQFIAGIISYLLTKINENEDVINENKINNNSKNKIILPFILAHSTQEVNNIKQKQIFNNNKQLSSNSSSSSTTIIKKSSINLLFNKYFIFNIILIILLIIIFFPFLIIPIYLRPFQNTLIVILISIILFIKTTNNNLIIYLILINPLNIWLGNISYILYLIHWPTILFLKYFFTIDEFSFKYGISTLILIIFISFIVELLVDSQIRKIKSFCTITFFIGILYTFCFFQLLPTYYSGQNERIAIAKDFDNSLGGKAINIDVNFTKLIINEIVKSSEIHSRIANSLSLYEVIRINEIIQSATYEDRYKILPGEVFTNRWIGKFSKMVPEERNFFKAIIERKFIGESNNSSTFLLVGNSHADIISRELQDEFKQYYSYFHTFTVPGCLPFYVPEHLEFVTHDHKMPKKACNAYAKLVKEAIENIKPDYLFIAFRWYGSFEEQPFNNNNNNDEILGIIQTFLTEIQSNVKQKIYFPSPNLLFKYETAKELAKRLWRGSTKLDELHISYKEHLKKNFWSYRRLEHLNCTKCLIYDLASYFCNIKNDRCAAFDETTKLAIFFDTNHLSYLGRQLVRPYLHSLINL